MYFVKPVVLLKVVEDTFPEQFWFVTVPFEPKSTPLQEHSYLLFVKVAFSSISVKPSVILYK